VKPRSLVITAVSVTTAALAGAALAATAIKPYAEPVGGEYTIRPLFSADDKVPLLGGAPGQ
jgi:hypothetical protein